MITLPKGLIELGDEAFSGCSAFAGQDVEIPNEVKIGKRVFLDTGGIHELRTMEPEFNEKGEAGNG